MNRRLTIPVLPLAALALLLAKTPARAESTTVLASYEAPDACPKRQDFVAAVEARGARFDEATDATAGRSASVIISAREGRFVGSLELRDAAGKSDPRQVEAPSCTEVVDALAVVAALALRPDEVTSALAPVAPAPKAEDPSVAPIAAEGPRRLRGHTEYGSRVLNVTAGKLRLDRENRVALSAGIMYGLIPSQPLARYDATFSTARFLTTPSGEQHLVGYIPHIRLTGVGPTTISNSLARTRAFGLVAAVGGCTSPLYDTGAFILLVCGDLGVGIMSLDTTSNGRTKQQSTPFWTAEVEAEAQYNFGSHFFVSLKGGVGFASRYYVAGGTGAQHSPLTANAMLGLGAHF